MLVLAKIYKKRDCTIAVPHSEALVLPFHPNNNTEAHAVCICAYAIRVHYLYTYQWASCVAVLWLLV